MIVSGHIWASFIDLAQMAFLIALAMTIGTVIAALIGGDKVDRPKIVRLAVLFLGLGFLGAVSGFAGGLSREAAVGDIIPAALALLGGVAAYLFGVDAARGVVTSLCAISFATALYFGYGIGSEKRAPFESAERIRSYCFSIFADADLVSDRKALAFHAETIGDICAASIANVIVRSGHVEEPYEQKLKNRMTSSLAEWVTLKD